MNLHNLKPAEKDYATRIRRGLNRTWPSAQTRYSPNHPDTVEYDLDGNTPPRWTQMGRYDADYYASLGDPAQ